MFLAALWMRQMPAGIDARSFQEQDLCSVIVSRNG
jgi:hypothetical protein